MTTVAEFIVMLQALPGDMPVVNSGLDEHGFQDAVGVQKVRICSVESNMVCDYESVEDATAWTKFDGEPFDAIHIG